MIFCRSGGEIVSACNYAGIKALSDGRSHITMKDVDFGVDKVTHMGIWFVEFMSKWSPSFSRILQTLYFDDIFYNGFYSVIYLINTVSKVTSCFICYIYHACWVVSIDLLYMCVGEIRFKQKNSEDSRNEWEDGLSRSWTCPHSLLLWWRKFAAQKIINHTWTRQKWRSEYCNFSIYRTYRALGCL